MIDLTNHDEILVCPSVLAADFANLKRDIAEIKDATPILHLDIMDGHFVPNISFGPGVVKSIRAVTDQFLDVHLMVSDPGMWVEPFAKAGADMIVIHVEATPHAERVLSDIKGRGLKAGVALTPQTPLSVLDYLLDVLDMVLVMTVNPGFGGQSFIPMSLQKIADLREKFQKAGRNIAIQVDGGIDEHTAPLVTKAGASLLVAGSAIFGKPDPVASLTAIQNAAVQGRQ